VAPHGNRAVQACGIGRALPLSHLAFAPPPSLRIHVRPPIDLARLPTSLLPLPLALARGTPAPTPIDLSRAAPRPRSSTLPAALTRRRRLGSPALGSRACPSTSPAARPRPGPSASPAARPRPSASPAARPRPSTLPGGGAPTPIRLTRAGLTPTSPSPRSRPRPSARASVQRLRTPSGAHVPPPPHTRVRVPMHAPRAPASRPESLCILYRRFVRSCS
jgi:hypothetical protein